MSEREPVTLEKRKMMSEEQEKVVKVKLLGPRKLTKEQMESPTPRSFWPFVLAVTIFIACVGLLIHPLLFFFGVLLIVGSLIGWLLERRSYLR